MGVFHLQKFGNFPLGISVWEKRVPFVTSLILGRPGRLIDRERHGTGDKEWNTNFSIGKFPPGKRDYLFKCFVSGKISKVWERLGFWYFVHEKSRGVGRFVQMRCFASTRIRSVVRAYALWNVFTCYTSLWLCPTGRGTPLYRLYRYVQPERVWAEKYSVDLGHFRLKLDMVFFHSSLELGKFLRSYFFHHSR